MSEKLLDDSIEDELVVTWVKDGLLVDRTEAEILIELDTMLVPKLLVEEVLDEPSPGLLLIEERLVDACS